MISVCGERVGVRRLPGLDHLDRRVQLGKQGTGREPVHDDDVGLGESTPTTGRDEAGITRATADEHHASRARAVTPQGEAAGVEQERDRVPQSRRAARVAARTDGHGDVARARDRRRPGARRGGVVGPDAPEACGLGIGRDSVVDLAVTGRGVHEPRTVQVGGQVLPTPPGHPVEQLDEVLAQCGGDDDHVCAVLDQPEGATSRDRSAADHDDAATREVEEQRVAAGHIPAPASQPVLSSSSEDVGISRSSNVSPIMPAASVVPSAGSTSRNPPVRRCAA